MIIPAKKRIKIKDKYGSWVKPNMRFAFPNLYFNQLTNKHLPSNNGKYSMLILSFLFLISCSSPDSDTMPTSNIVVNDKLVWVYTHSPKDGMDYTVFSPEKPVNKSALPHNFLAIKNRKKEKWNCLLKWEGDVLWFYTPSSHSFASHNSEDGKTKWTIIEEKDFNYFFFEDLDGGFIRFSNECGKKGVLCLDAEEVVIGM